MQFFSVLCLTVLFVLPSAFLSSASAEPLYRIKGKTVTGVTLNPVKQSVFNQLKVNYYEAKLRFAKDQVLEAYYDKLAAKEGKTRLEVEKELLHVKKLNQEELKEFYNNNKENIPYPYFLVKDKLADYYKGFAKEDLREKVFKKARKSLNAKILLPKPVAGTIAIDTSLYAKKSSDKARHTLIKVGDYQCPYCKSAHKLLPGILEKLGKKVEFVYVDFFNPSSRGGKAVAEVAYCIRKHKSDSAYWAYHDHAYKNQMMMFSTSAGRRFAEETKNWDTKVEKCYTSKEGTKFVNASHEFAKDLGVTETPTFFLDGKKMKLPATEKLAVKKIRKLM